MDILETTIKKLKESPMYYMFISSRELFHSNFWVWLSELDKNETIKLFTNDKFTGDLKFTPEKNLKNDTNIKSKVDLLISNNNVDIILIENKVKDFPTIEQLERIKASLGLSNPQLILTTLFWSADFSFKDWKVRTYKEISESINPEKFTTNKYFQNLIQDYKEFTLNLSLIAENLEIIKKYDFAPSFDSIKKLFEKLDDIKLREGYLKIRASHLIFHFKKNNIHKVECNYSINHKRATLDFFIIIKKGYTIGITIEDNSYRKVISGIKHNEFSENLRKNNIFFDSNWKSNRGKLMLGYEPKWKYQKDLKPIKELDYPELFEKINEDIKIIIRDMNKIIQQIPN